MGLINDDCMNILPKYEDNYFDLAIVDPPYGIKRFGDRVETTNRLEPIKTKINEWDIKPSPEYFKELFRVSKNQIIWGANNFTLPNTEYFIVWDKQQTVDNFASAEYAWTNIKKPAKVFRHSIHKVMVSRKQEKGKIHPTQKPVALYRWLLENYAEPTDMILDTHLGSGSSAIACHYFGTQVFVGIEIDKEYFDMASERIAKETRQIKLL
tara:strand:- start:17 stop:646 length:630 start_codon:yes stop_codon:yes gene_type:complete